MVRESGTVDAIQKMSKSKFLSLGLFIDYPSFRLSDRLDVNKTERKTGRERSKPSVENEHFETRKLYAYINKKVDLIYRNSLIATESQPTAIESEVDVVMLAFSPYFCEQIGGNWSRIRRLNNRSKMACK